jgi:putative lipoic acid-binding regulatory protein
MSDKQLHFDGGATDGEIFDARLALAKAMDTGWAVVSKILPDDGNPRTAHRLAAVPEIETVDPHFLTDAERQTAFLWTAEEAGLEGKLAERMSIVHMETDGEIELVFASGKRAGEALRDMAERYDEGDSLRYYIMNDPYDDKILEVYDGGDGTMYDDWGTPDDAWNYSYVEDDEMFMVLDPENNPVHLIHHDMMYEHTDPITIATHDGVFKFASRGGVMWNREYYSDAPEWAWDAAAAQYNGEGFNWNRVSAGWHSSMERSELSDMINDLTSGNLPPEVDGPVMVKFSGTGNVCSVGINVYAEHERDAEILRDYLTDARAAPGYAGVR